MLLVHPGGPFWARKDLGAWSIPKGEHDDGEEPRACARREFAEETGTALPDGALTTRSVKRKSGKRVAAFAAAGDLDPATVRSNTFELEWPPRSGRTQSFPEIDRAEWFGARRGAREAEPRPGRVRGPAGGAAWPAEVPGVGVEPTRPLGQSTKIDRAYQLRHPGWRRLL